LQSRFDNYYYSQRNYVSALRVSNHLIEINGNIAAYYNLKGNCLYALGEIEKAIDNYERAYDIDSLTIYARNIGNASLALSEIEPSNSQQHLSNAIKYYTLTMNTEPNDISTLHQIAYSYYKIRDYKNSMDFYDRILSLDSKNTGAIAGKSNIYYDKREYKEAILLLENILKEEKLESYIYLITAMNLEGQYYIDKNIAHISKAKHYLKKSLEYHPNDKRAEQFLFRLNSNHPIAQ
jgi:tetratricopeptide (TPR) repeat protein